MWWMVAGAAGGDGEAAAGHTGCAEGEGGRSCWVWWMVTGAVGVDGAAAAASNSDALWRAALALSRSLCLGPFLLLLSCCLG